MIFVHLSGLIRKSPNMVLELYHAALPRTRHYKRRALPHIIPWTHLQRLSQRLRYSEAPHTAHHQRRFYTHEPPHRALSSNLRWSWPPLNPATPTHQRHAHSGEEGAWSRQATRVTARLYIPSFGRPVLRHTHMAECAYWVGADRCFRRAVPFQCSPYLATFLVTEPRVARGQYTCVGSIATDCVYVCRWRYSRPTLNPVVTYPDGQLHTNFRWAALGALR